MSPGAVSEIQFWDRNGIAATVSGTGSILESVAEQVTLDCHAFVPGRDRRCPNEKGASRGRH